MDAPETSVEWTCPGCGTAASTRFCPTCGETRPDGRDLTLRAFLVEAIHTVTDIDRRVLRSFRALLLRPGELTAAYRAGRRKAFLAPLQIFLLANVAFFALEALSRDHVFSTSLASHVSVQDWKEAASWLVSGRLERIGSSFEDYAARFDPAAARNAKALVALMALPFMLLLPAFQPGKSRGFVVRAAFALHLYAFLLVLFSLALVFAAIQSALGGDGLRSPSVDTWLSTVLLGGCIGYLFVALRRVYPDADWLIAVRAIGLGIIVAAIVPGYRFVIFLITLYTTR